MFIPIAVIRRHFQRYFALLCAIVGMLALASPTAWAVPSFSRQTGLSCDTCHTVPPQLTPFGRFFKMNGYVLSSSTLTPPTSGNVPKESIGAFPPLSVMFQAADTYLNKAVPGTQNHSVSFPQQLSMFYAGRIAPNLGAFMQVTYDGQADHFSLDNTDIRYAHNTMFKGTPVLWGLTFNNNPTVEDPWNSTPAWGFPYVGPPDGTPTPDAAPLITGLGQQVAGLGAYGWIDNAYYVSFSVYRSAQIAQPLPLDNTAGCAAAGCVVSGLAPYWRLGWQHDWSEHNFTHSLEVGTLGMIAHVYPTGVSGLTDNYIDLGVDSQYQVLWDHSSLNVHALYIHENQKLNATFADGGSTNLNDNLNSWDINAQYYWQESYGPSLGFFDTTGSTDPLLYSGSRTSSPDSSGWQLQWTYLPWQNVQLGAQYTIYTRFNGASSNYDGSGRSAGDNDTLYMFAWLLW